MIVTDSALFIPDTIIVGGFYPKNISARFNICIVGKPLMDPSIPNPYLLQPIDKHTDFFQDCYNLRQQIQKRRSFGYSLIQFASLRFLPGIGLLNNENRVMTTGGTILLTCRLWG